MGKRLIAALAAVLLLGALAGGCGGDGGTTPALVAGSWGGSLSLTTIAGRTYVGTITLDLAQDGDFAAGVASWAPLGEPQTATLSLDGNAVTLRLSFLCRSQGGGVTLTGVVDGDSLRVDGARGVACFGRGEDERVSSGLATLVREPSAEPL